VLRTRYLVIASILFVILGYISWKPLPFQLSRNLHLLITILGAVIFIPGLLLYIWGLHTLGQSFNASSGFGVRLQQSHQLVTIGPYAYVRHPMYIAVMLTGWGGLLLFLTWTMFFFAVIMFGLIARAHKEEEILAEVYREKWELYKQDVPAWFPKLKSIMGK
jgi:protein-S-isoprenylcysteine O-methyltransferase Ste14